MANRKNKRMKEIFDGVFSITSNNQYELRIQDLGSGVVEIETETEGIYIHPESWNEIKLKVDELISSHKKD